MDEEVRVYSLVPHTLQHAVGDSKGNRRQDKRVETHCGEANTRQRSEKVSSWTVTNRVLISVARVSDFNLQKY